MSKRKDRPVVLNSTEIGVFGVRETSVIDELGADSNISSRLISSAESLEIGVN